MENPKPKYSNRSIQLALELKKKTQANIDKSKNTGKIDKPKQ